MRKWIFSVAVMSVLTGLAGAAQADELAELRQQLKQLQQQVEALEARQAARPEVTVPLEARIDALEDAQAQQVEQTTALSKKMETPSLPSNLKWLESIRLSGDIRMRYERIDEQHDGRPDRNRARFRARVRLDADVHPDWSLGFRLSSAPDADPTSANQTFGDSFSRKDVYIDLAYIDFHPESIAGLNVIAGKMNNPFHTVGRSQLIWASELTPEGVAATYRTDLSETMQLFGSAGAFYVRENARGNDLALYGAQLGLRHAFNEETHVLGGLSYYVYDEVKGMGDLDRDPDETDFFGNSNFDGVYLGGYELVNLFIEYGTMLGEMPVAVFGDYVKNTVAATSGDTGWLIGTRVNRMRKPGSWEVSYDYRDLQKDAVLGVFSDSTFIGGGTGGRGHRFGVGYQITDNVTTALNYFMNTKNVDGVHRDYDRLQADVVVRF
ncbi:MAG TPA: putative porin [Sedimentisphaerales bacterium]|nr:putative porin [Sedimentisphaerales bacterium]